MKNVLITICARGGSKGVKNKNIVKVKGTPLIAYTIKHAQLLQKKLSDKGLVVHIMLSSDSASIIDCAREYNCSNHNYIRPEKLASDQAGKIEVLYDAKKYCEKRFEVAYDYLIDLDVSSPIRKTEEVMEAFADLESNREAYNIFSVSEANKNPYFNMVEPKSDGFVELSKKIDANVMTRQEAKSVLALNASFYIYRESFFKNDQKGAITDKSMAYLMKDICFDIDEEVDLLFFEYLLTHHKLKMSL